MSLQYECESITADHLFFLSPPNSALRGIFLEICGRTIESFFLCIIKLPLLSLSPSCIVLLTLGQSTMSCCLHLTLCHRVADTVTQHSVVLLTLSPHHVMLSTLTPCHVVLLTLCHRAFLQTSPPTLRPTSENLCLHCYRIRTWL